MMGNVSPQVGRIGSRGSNAARCASNRLISSGQSAILALWAVPIGARLFEYRRIETIPVDQATEHEANQQADLLLSDETLVSFSGAASATRASQACNSVMTSGVANNDSTRSRIGPSAFAQASTR